MSWTPGTTGRERLEGRSENSGALFGLSEFRPVGIWGALGTWLGKYLVRRVLQKQNCGAAWGMRLVSMMPGGKDLLTQPQFFLGIWGRSQVSVELPASVQIGPRVRPVCFTNVADVTAHFSL